MDNLHSFEQRSASDFDPSQTNRVIFVNRRDPKAYWSTANRLGPPARPQDSWWPFSSFCSPTFYRGRRTRRAQASRAATAHKRTTPIEASLTLSYSSSDMFDFGPFATNELKTSKYTLFNFLPKNLFEQFRRLANFYFLTTGILQLVLPYSPVGPTTSLLPLFFVVATTAIKQAYEDFLRHKLDREVNNRQCHVLADKKLTKIPSKDIRVGDIVYVKNNEEIPCDMILLAASGPGDRCHVTTANLDGETSLKGRTCFAIKSQIGTIDKIDETLLVVECERPNATLYEFNGLIRAPKSQLAYEKLIADLQLEVCAKQLPKTVSVESYSQIETKRVSILQTIYKRIKQTNRQLSRITSDQLKKLDSDGAIKLIGSSSTNGVDHFEVPLDISNLLLRASRLRNTSHVYGLAVYTGRDTKLAHNSQVKPNKFSSLESRVNLFLVIAFIILLLLTLISSLRYKQQKERWYIGNSFKIESFLEIMLAHFLLYNYLVPISLYVTLEFVKFFGTIAVIEDKKLRAPVWTTITNNDPDNNLGAVQLQPPPSSSLTPLSDALKTVPSSHRVQKQVGPQCNSSDLNEDLGQVEVLFSDKTGTLTENRMLFMACSVYGRLYRSLANQLYSEPPGLCELQIQKVARKLATINTNRYSSIAPSSAIKVETRAGSHSDSAERANKSGPSLPRPFDHRQVPALSELRLINDLEQHESVAEFFTCLCLCSTITLNESTPLQECLPDKTDYDYQTASPDEESLISAAALHGVTLCKSSEREVFLAITRPPSRPQASQLSSSSPPSQQQQRHSSCSGTFKPIVETKNSTSKFVVRHFERLMTLEFNSTRKRMSVIYRDCDNDCHFLVTKGSEIVLDFVKLTNLSAQVEHSIDETLAHFEAFAKSGLRTMLVARRFLSKSEFERIACEMRDARLSIQNREQMLANVYKRAESNLQLVGATAVEDSLQDGVPETIASLREAGIKVWLLTGDKVETAISVAYLCRLLDRDMSLLNLVRQRDAKACKRLLRVFCRQIQAGRESVKLSSETASVRVAPKSSSSSPPQSRRATASRESSGSSSAAAAAAAMAEADAHNSRKSTNCFALIADGRSLHYAMKWAKVELAFVCKACDCVLGCRLSPLQKAEIVDMIKQSDEAPITAAIGDGANDVSMIQEAHVGIGISGKEGRQAVNSSDFAVNRFHMLNRLFFIHGHLFYHRTANTIHYFFYKNVLFILPQFLYSFYSLSSGSSLYLPLMLITFNLLFTSLPILLYGLLEVHVAEQLLEHCPRFYRINKRNYQMRLSVFVSWQMIGIAQALLIFHLLFYFWADQTPFAASDGGGDASSDPKNKPPEEKQVALSMAVFFSVVLTATVKLYLLSKSHNIWFNLAAICSCALLPSLFYGASLLDTDGIIGNTALFRRVLPILQAPNFWFAVASSLAATALTDVVFHLTHYAIHTKRMATIVGHKN